MPAEYDRINEILIKLTDLLGYDSANEHCPVCGYYCDGNGGIGCIDKPTLCGLDRETLADKLYISKRIQGEKR